jgi:hypothetical protein
MLAVVDVDDVIEDEVEKVDVNIKNKTPKKVTKITPFTKGSKSEMTPAEWTDLVENYFKKPVTTLDLEREKYYSQLDVTNHMEAEEEYELYEMKKVRMENKIIIKAKLELMYEQKEAARRAAEWKRRKVFQGFKIPKPIVRYKSLK